MFLGFPDGGVDHLDLRLGLEEQTHLARGGFLADTPIRATLERARGKAPSPLAGTTTITLKGVRNEFLPELETLTGWSPVPVALESTDINDAYSLISICGRAGPFDPHRVTVIPCDNPYDADDFEVKGFFFVNDEWDGSDIFVLQEDAFFVLMSDRAKHCIEDLCGGFCVPEFTPLAEVTQHWLGVQSLIKTQRRSGFITVGKSWRPDKIDHTT